MRMSDWSSDVCSSDLPRLGGAMGFLGSDGGTDGFYLPTTVFGWTVRISRRNDVGATRRRPRAANRPSRRSRRLYWLLADRPAPPQPGTDDPRGARRSR